MVSSAMMKLHGVLPWTKKKTKNKIPLSLLHSMSHHYQHSKLNSTFSDQDSQMVARHKILVDGKSKDVTDGWISSGYYEQDPRLLSYNQKNFLAIQFPVY